jgi:hypothetical protein
MSLNTVQLKADLKALCETSQTGTGTAADNLEAYLNALVAALDAFVKSGQVVYIDGLTAGPYPVTGTYNGDIE